MGRFGQRIVSAAGSPAASWVATYGCVLAVLAWTRHLGAFWLVAAGLAAVGALVALRAGRESARFVGATHVRAALAVCVLALVVGTLSEARLARIERDWPAVAAARQSARALALSRQLDDAAARIRSAAQQSAAIGETAGSSRPFNALSVVREQVGVDAVMLFNDAGNLTSWSGEHRGAIPAEVRVGAIGAHFVERPLYSYLYVVAPIGGSGGARAAAAVLVETALAGDRGGPDRNRSLRALAGAEPILRAGAGRGEGVVWSLAEDADTIVHARLEPITESALRRNVEAGGRRAGVLAGLGALLLLSIGWTRWLRSRHVRSGRGAPLLAASLALAVAPLGPALGIEGLYSPLVFVLPSTGDLTLGTAFAIALPLAAFIAGIHVPPVRGRGRAAAILVGAAAIAIGYPAAIRLLLHGATPKLLAGSATLWLGLQVVGALALAVLGVLAMPRFTQPLSPFLAGRRGNAVLAGALIGSGLLGLVALVPLEPTRPAPAWLAALWVVPFLAAALALAHRHGPTARLARWLACGWIAGTAVLPHLWVAHVEARLAAAERELESLGGQPPLFLDFLLVEFGREVANRSAVGEDGVQLLYRSWVASNLASQPYGAHIILWSAEDVPGPPLALGGARTSRAAAAVACGGAGEVTSEPPRCARVQRVRRTGEILVQDVPGLPDVTKVLAAPLGDGRVVTLSVPPRRSLERPSAVAPFLGAPADPHLDLTLVEAQGPSLDGAIAWERAGNAWRTEARVQYPEGPYHAHLDVRVAALGIRIARAVLLLAFDLLVLLGLWLIANAARGVPTLRRAAWHRWRGSFRARVTVALFSFFLIPTIAFGWVAYRALADEVERSARRIAERTVKQAVAEFPQPISDLAVLAERTGTEVLRFFDGELYDASSPETRELGVYDAWMPVQVFLDMERGEEAEAVAVQQLGRQSFLLAYHVLRPAGVLAVPTALSSGETAVRQRELAHLILFAALLGALLSLALSVAVGRTLAGPIGKLGRAATAVGSGHLNVKLPEAAGEFGELFASFNRMTRRLRRARAQEVRTARVLAWGEMARQIAHEIKNPLTPIKLAVQHLRRAHADRRPDFGGILEENVEQILGEIDRLTEIARAFSRYGAPGDLTGPLGPVDVAVVVREALTLYRAGESAVAYRSNVPLSLPRAQARAGELKEVLLNLLENARAVIDGDGSIEVRAREVGERIELEVSDNGPGIPAELMPRIFEPHFSTRSTGTGLGLAIVRRIVESWGGSVTAESEPGVGTTVRVRMLAAAAPADA